MFKYLEFMLADSGTDGAKCLWKVLGAVRPVVNAISL